MIRVTSTGPLRATHSYLDKLIGSDKPRALERAAQKGVDALRSATPADTGLTAESWGYEIEKSDSGYVIWWTNTNVVDGFNVAVGLQYGHGTGTGGWVAGYDYINPALQRIFGDIAIEIGKEVL